MASSTTAAGFDVDSFANYLISDLGFLLALFGDLPTKQFLALSTGWYDNIALAVAPIGIPTIMVSAIRVAGANWLKAIIGRARESRASAEVEVLSSTSAEVCELWSGNQIVRVAGQAPIKEIIRYVTPMSGQPACAGKEEWMDLAKATSSTDATSTTLHPRTRYNITRTGGGGNILGGTIKDNGSLSKLMIASSTSAPNLTLNIDRDVYTGKGGIGMRVWKRVWAAAVLALILQLAVVTVWTLTTYHWKVGRANRPPPRYGFPCAVGGAGLLFFGILLCGHVVEDVTAELHAVPARNPERFSVMRIQRSCTAGSQNFDGYLIHNKDGDPTISMSRRLPDTMRVRRHRTFTLVGTLSASTGFIVQFIGLRTLHWGATIAQLVATMAMIVIRAWLRRNLLDDPRCEKLLSKYEISDATFAICRVKLQTKLRPGSWTCPWVPKVNAPATGQIKPEYMNYGWGLSTSIQLEISNPNTTAGNNPNTATGNPSQTNDIEADAESFSSSSADPELKDPDSHNEAQLKHWEERLVRTRVELGYFTEWEEDCTIWGERVATAAEDVFRKLETMSSGRWPRLTFKNVERTRSWQLATYVRRSKHLILRSTFTIDPNTLPNYWYAVPADRDGHIRRVKDSYSAILCLWHCRIVKRRAGVNYKPQFPFARVVDAFGTEVKRSGLIQDWLRTPLSEVPRDYHWAEWRGKLFDPALSFGRRFAVEPSVNHL
ncbi:uncharacterized protein Z519_05955 [Cladophialophora bantiana CBS 173.52]|uniref:Uncharacterized protein n=1 Tax=Cladophialophora bantiana (strain ATCC 10958 / CBS 173.52 / CDC B-1940 / NIH 8579) TaxID=1442370 RepID=A0A0D2HR76_CLAB1|nr:uncharacterized protein Z519_05955 [Cladophialophora bantiana CBS 173.52]KIW93350.1 hypothetical protein Z519_05955 [Cladophialophora bantiana CBS 173.52]